MMFACFNASAKTQKFKDFLGDCKYEIVVGFNSSETTSPFVLPKYGYNLGVTARKEVTTFMEDKVGIYGLVGLVLTKRGGTTEYKDILADPSKKVIHSAVQGLSLPIHVGGEYKFKKCSLFVDLGPNVFFKTRGADFDNISTNSVTFGGGYDVGIRFKRFALGLGFDTDFTNIGTFEANDQQMEDFHLTKRINNLKTSSYHFLLRWTL